mgnify:CR=1 FL=1|tara:strand:+ start:1141 stop:1965 length:825 start_codon:yes stop_codon:yes gene_type:complete
MAFPLDPEQRFRAKQSSVGQATASGKGLGARLSTKASVATSRARTAYSEGRIEDAMQSTSKATKAKEEIDIGLEMDGWIAGIRNNTQLSEETEEVTPEVTQAAPTSTTQESPNLDLSELANKLAKSTNDPTFISAVKDLAKKYNTTPSKVYGIINVESVWDPTVINERGYSGLFQIGEEPAGEAGIDYDNLSTMTPTQQVAAYDKYLSRWNYDGSVSLGLMQAAPGLASRLKGSPPDTVVYAVDSKEWKANRKWRSGPEGKGPVTLGSLDKVYN